MGTTTMKSAAASKPQPTTPSRPMAQASPDHPAPMAMTVVELEAAIAALPGKRDALREAFDRLAACSPSPLPFAWEDLDGHISSLQLSIALRFRQLRVLEAAGAAPAASALGGTRGDGEGENQEEELEEDEEEEEEEGVVEVEVEEEVAVEVEKEEEEKADDEIQEADSDKICNDEKDGKEAGEVEEEVAELENKADEDMQEPDSDKFCSDEKDGKEAREVELEEVAKLEKKADVDMQELDSDKFCSDEKDGKEAREVEVEEVAELEKKADEEMQEPNYDNICNDEKDRKEAREEVVEEEEVEESASVMIGNEKKEEKEAREEEQDPDKAMQMVDKEELNTKDAFKASQDKEEDQDTNMDETVAKMASSVQSCGKKQKQEQEQEQEAQEQDVHDKVEDQDTNMDETVAKMASSVQSCGKKQEQEQEAQEQDVHDKVEDQDTNMDETVAKMASSVQFCGKKQKQEQEQEAEEQDVHDKVEGAKIATDKEAVVANEVSSDRGNRAFPCRSDDRTVASADMDAQRLVKLICTNTEFNSEFHAAARRAPDAAAVVLHVVELFLQNKIFVKTSKVWASCVGLLRMVPVVVIKPSADTIEQAKRVAKDWKEMIDNPESFNVLGNLASWALLYFLISYNIVTEFDTKEIFRLLGSIPSKQKKSAVLLLKGLGLFNRIPELMDCLIENGQQMDVLGLARVFNMVDKYPSLSLLKGYIEKAKQTAMEIPQRNMTHKFQRAFIIKELDNLKRAHVLAKNEITDSNLCISIRKEIAILIGELEKKKRSLANPLTASTSNSQQQQTKSKKLKIEQKQEHHKGQENQMQGQLSELAEKLEKKQRKPQQEQQQKQEDRPEEEKQKQEDEPEEKKRKQEDKQEEKKQKQEDKPEEKKRKQEDKPKKKQQQKKQKHHKRLRQHTPKLPTQGYPAMWNAALRGGLEHPPYAAMHGMHHGYPAQPGWPGVHCASPPFMPQLGAPEYIGPFTPLYPRPQFYHM